MRTTPPVLVIAGLVALTGCTRTVIVREPAPAPAPAPRPRAEARRGEGVGPLGIPPGQMPRAGQCRIWIRGLPPGRQPRPKSRSCRGIEAAAPAGSWILYRPRGREHLVRVRMVDERRAGVVVRIRVFDFDTGRYLREEKP